MQLDQNPISARLQGNWVRHQKRKPAIASVCVANITVPFSEFNMRIFAITIFCAQPHASVCLSKHALSPARYRQLQYSICADTKTWTSVTAWSGWILMGVHEYYMPSSFDGRKLGQTKVRVLRFVRTSRKQNTWYLLALIETLNGFQ